MKTIRNGVVVGVSLLGGCTSVETRFDALRVACIKDAFIPLARKTPSFRAQDVSV
ncbi:urease-enhancing factor [Helicobacter pylori]|nr:urease-enhancing factor [Helicobacter pylori]WRE02470.1 urease-enhancing factor [Helicobacter pylori]